MDTLKEKQAFDDMHARGETPWTLWKSEGAAFKTEGHQIGGIA
jgi:hypothetical protein